MLGLGLALAVLTGGALGIPTAPPAAAEGSRAGQLWTARYDDPNHGDDFFRQAVVSPDGATVFAAGTSDVGLDSDYLTAAFDSTTGATLWVRTYDGPIHDSDFGQDLALSPDGSRLFVTGNSYGASGQEYATVAYDATDGGQLWAARYRGAATGNSGAMAVATSPDGGTVYVTGSVEKGQFSGDDDIVTLAYDAANGNQRWRAQYDGPGTFQSEDFGIDVATSPDGTLVFVTGNSDQAGSGFKDFATLAYDTVTGAGVWVARFGGSADDAVGGLAVGLDGTVYVVGQVLRATFDYAAVAYDPGTGTSKWTSYYDAGSNEYVYYGPAVAPDGGRVYMTGNSWGGATQKDYATVALEASNGNQAWVARYNGPAGRSDYGNRVAASADGMTIVTTGSSSGAGFPAQDIATMANRASTGGRLIVSRYDNNGGFDIAYGVAVGPLGLDRAFAAGSSGGNGTGDDAIVIAYGA